MKGKDQEIFSIVMVVTITWLSMKGCSRQEELGMTRYLVVIDVMKRQENSGRKQGRARGEHYNFLGHKGARQLGAQPALV